MRNGVLRAEPAARVEVEVALGASRPLLQLGRKRGEDFQPGVRKHAAEAELGSRRRRDEERLRLGSREAGELRAVPPDQPVAPRGPPHGLHRHAGSPERLDVSVDRPHGDLEVRGELLRRRLAPQLEQEQQGDKPCRPHRA